MGNVLSFNIGVLQTVGPKATVYWSWYKSLGKGLLSIESKVFTADDEFVSVHQKDVEKELGLTPAEQKTARRRLVESGYLQERRSGVPSRIFVKCYEEPMDNGLSQGSPVSAPSTFSQLFQKRADNNQLQDEVNNMNPEVPAEDVNPEVEIDDEDPQIPEEDVQPDLSDVAEVQPFPPRVDF